MTGTASEIFDYNKETSGKLNNGKLSNIDLLSAWIFGRINADGILNDISESGCSILLPKNESTPLNAFKLIIMSPDNDKNVHSILSSQARWQDNNFTQTQKKIGIEFLDITDDLRGEINALKPFFYNPALQQIKCSLLKP